MNWKNKLIKLVDYYQKNDNIDDPADLYDPKLPRVPQQHVRHFSNGEFKMKNKILFPLILTFFIMGCATGIQKVYWGAGTTVASDEEKKGNFKVAETEYIVALRRAENYLDQKAISDSLYNLGAFYRRQERVPEAIKFLKKSLSIEESLTGMTSERTGRRLAELSAAYLMDSDWNKGKVLIERLKPIVSQYTGREREFVEMLIKEVNKDESVYQKKINELLPLVQKGDPVAQYELATYYEDGRGVEQDYNKAIELYKASAHKGILAAEYYLGVIYDKGRGVEPDHIKARKWYKISAEKGHSLAQYNYGVYLETGRGGPKDVDLALQYFRKSAEQGCPSAISAVRGYQQK